MVQGEVKNMRILVTGGAGYIGSVLCARLLTEGHRVTVLDNLMYEQSSLLHLCPDPNFEFVLGDVRDERVLAPLVKDSDVLIPLAALVGAPACERDPHSAHSVNLKAIRLLKKFRSPGQLVVFPTTNSGYGTKSGELLCTEETPLEPISVYGRTKVAAERELLGEPSVITLRLATVFGVSPRMRLDLLVNHFVHQAVTEGGLVLFEPHFKRNFMHIADVADCFVHCIEHSDGMTGRPYNVGLPDANLSKAELAERVKAHLPFLNIYLSATGTDPDQRNYVVSNERIRQAGFTARRTLDQGIAELVKGYRMLPSRPWRNA